MRKILTLLCTTGFLVISGTGFSASLHMTTAMNEDEPEIIVLQPEIGSPDDAPRGPVFNPFTAYLLNNQVVLESSENCGLVTVEITSTTGFYFSTVFDTEDGFIVMPVSGNVGSYTLTLTMSSGDVFTGIFTI